MKYHPDVNPSAEAERKFQEIRIAYEEIIVSGGTVHENDYSWRDVEEVLRAERERVNNRARARAAKKRKEQLFYENSEWHDIILFLRYLLHGIALLLSFLAVLVPIALAIFLEPAILLGTIYFLIIGGFMLFYIYGKRKTWFRLGKFNTRWNDITSFFKMPESKVTSDYCCYTKSLPADGRSYNIELLKTVDILFRSYGFLNHGVKYKNKTRRIILPRSTRAQYWHRLSSLIKVTSIISSIIFIPLDSILWRFIIGIFLGGLLSCITLQIVKVRSKVSWLFTPSLIIKLGIWLIMLYSVSVFGPGFNIQTTANIYIVLLGLLFILDMVFDLILGFLPFYRKLFIPVFKQGDVLNTLYKEGFQNYQELPVYSILFPFFKWLF